MATQIEGKKRPKSTEIFSKSEAVVPGGVNSPVRSFYSLSTKAVVAEKGAGDTIWDVDGNPYIDYCCSWGPLILGHGDPDVLKALHEQLDRATTFGITTEIEQKLAEKICTLIPSVEKVRFVSSGTEAGMSVHRLARGYTGRDLIVKFNGHYHGHSDAYLLNAGSGATDLESSTFSAGVPQDVIKNTVSLPFNEVETVREFIRTHGDKIAGVILEPIAGNMGLVPSKHEFVQMLREETKAVGALLIFDEVISGFRASLTGAQGVYGIEPDLSLFGKIIGGGLPAAAFGGKREIMDCLAPLGKVYQAGTLSGNPLAMVAGYETIKKLEKPGFYAELEEKTNRITRPVKQFIEKYNIDACLQQHGSLFTLFFGLKKVEKQEDLHALDQKRFCRFFNFLFENGVYPPPSAYEAFFVSIVHSSDHLDRTRDLIIQFLEDEYQL